MLYFDFLGEGPEVFKPLISYAGSEPRTAHKHILCLSPQEDLEVNAPHPTPSWRHIVRLFDRVAVRYNSCMLTV